MWPRSGRSRLISRWLVVTLAASIVSAVDGGWLAQWAALVPSKVLHGQVWRLVTWPFVQTSPLALIFTLVVIYRLGGDLAVRWGDRRLRRFATEIILAAALVTCLLASAVGASYLHRLGGWAVTDMLVIAWARQFPEQPLVLYGLLVVRGRQLVQVTIAATLIYVLFWGPIALAPELTACLAAAMYPRGWLSAR